jgi:hypothetical protein
VTARLYTTVYAPNDLPTEEAHIASKSLGTVNEWTELEYRVDEHGTGKFKGKINRHLTQAALLEQDRYLLVHTDAGVVGGAFLDGAPIDLSAAEGPGDEWMEWVGRSQLAYLERGMMDNDSNLLGGKNPIDGYWDLDSQGNFAGASNAHPIPMYKRAVVEMLLNSPSGIDEVDHSSFDYDLDSNGAAVPFLDGEAQGADVGDDGLTLLIRMDQLGGVVWELTYLFKLNAYLTHGTDRSGAFGAGTVRLEKGVNAAKAIARNVRGSVYVSHLLVGGAEFSYRTVVDPDWSAGEVVRWGFLAVPEASDPTQLDAAGLAHIERRKRQTDAWEIPLHDHGDDPTVGIYEPAPDIVDGHFWLGDTITHHTGTGTYDSNEEATPVASITWRLKTGRDANGDYVVIVGIGSTFNWSPTQAAQGAAGSQFRLCRPRRNVLLGLSGSYLKSASENASFPRENAVDGTAIAFSHVASGAVAEDYLAADTAGAETVDAYRYLAHSDPVDWASAVSIYGSNDDAAWAWLPAGKISADPAANGWTLLTSFSGLGVSSDTGEIGFGTQHTYRYWLFRATAGATDPTSDWDIGEVELWANSLTGTDPCATRGDHLHIIETLKTNESDTSLVLHPDGQGGVEWGTEAGPTSGTVRLSDIETHHPFLIVAHSGDMNPTDGYPEGTLEGYRQAILRGAHRVDLDLRKTSDGVWVILHDATLNRTTNLTGDVSAATLATIKAGHIDGGDGYDAGRHGTTLDVPTLDEIVEALKPYDVTYQFDNKIASVATQEELAQFVVDNGIVSRVAMNASGAEGAAILAINPNITVGGIDYGTPDYDDVTDFAYVIAQAPLQVIGVVPRAEFGTADEAQITRDLFENGARGITANDVLAAVEALNGLLVLDQHTDDATDAHDASAISAADAGGYFTGTDVEAQLQELGAAMGSTTVHDEPLTDGASNFIFAGGDIVVVVGVPN